MKKHLILVDIQKAFTNSKTIYDNIEVNNSLFEGLDTITYSYDISNTVHYTFWGNKENHWIKNADIINKYDYIIPKKFGYLRPIIDNLDVNIVYELINKLHLEGLSNFNNYTYKELKTLFIFIGTKYYDYDTINESFDNFEKDIRRITFDNTLYQHIISTYNIEDQLILIGGSTKFCLKEMYHLLIGLGYTNILIMDEYTYT